MPGNAGEQGDVCAPMQNATEEMRQKESSSGVNVNPQPTTPPGTPKMVPLLGLSSKTSAAFEGSATIKKASKIRIGGGA